MKCTMMIDFVPIGTGTGDTAIEACHNRKAPLDTSQFTLQAGSIHSVNLCQFNFAQKSPVNGVNKLNRTVPYHGAEGVERVAAQIKHDNA